MSKIPFALALVSATFGLSLLAPANALTKADCRPLTADNARECCAAPNWKALITSRDEVICKKPEFSTPLAATLPATATPPETPAPGTEPPEQTAGFNNGHGNLDQNAPGNSEPSNNAENSANSGLGNSGNGGGGKTF